MSTRRARESWHLERYIQIPRPWYLCLVKYKAAAQARGRRKQLLPQSPPRRSRRARRFRLRQQRLDVEEALRLDARGVGVDRAERLRELRLRGAVFVHASKSSSASAYFSTTALSWVCTATRACQRRHSAAPEGWARGACTIFFVVAERGRTGSQRAEFGAGRPQVHRSEAQGWCAANLLLDGPRLRASR